MPTKIIFTAEQLEELKQLIANNVVQAEIASHFGTTDTVIRQICRENGIELSRAKKEYTCVVCNQTFMADYKSMICPQCKATPAKCVVCGKEFERKQPYTQKTCSSKCRGIYRKESGIGKAIGNKMKATKLERYGTLDPSEVTKAKNGGELNKKKCKLCGKEFTPETPWQVYCKDIHYGACPVCGKPTEIKDYSIGPQACSEKCRMARINATCLERYGNKDAVNSEHAKILGKQHSLERYGKEHYSQTDEYKERFRAASLEKFGTEHPMQNKEVQAKAVQTNQERYGADYYFQSEEGKAKNRAIQEELYGGIGLASPILKEKAIQTNRERYGTDWGFNNDEIKRKIANTNRDRYGSDNFWSSAQDMERRISDPTKIKSYLAFKADPKSYVESHYSSKPPIYVLAKDLGVSDTPVYDILIQNNCKDVIDRTKVSTMEYEMHNFLKELVPDTEIRVNDRLAIKPKELDFYLPEYNFAIECNPTLTHNSTINSWDDSGDIMPYNYHKLKSIAAANAGIFLMHIFGYEWEHKRDILKSMIANSLGCSQNHLYARKTHIVEVSSDDTKHFLDANHRQGNANSRIRLGLVTDDTNELVSLMTFGHMRPGIGKHDYNDISTYELVRFCNKLNTNVVGGASKLLKYFIHEYDPGTIVSFSDVAHTKGKLYETLGFSKVSESDPGYCWVKPYGEVYRNRVSCQKHNLPNMFNDVTKDTIEEKSERMIMIEHGYLQVFDSGVIRWEWKADWNK